MKPEGIDRVVEQIDRTRREEHFRIPDRPDAQVFKPKKMGRRVPVEIVRAQTRLRSAAWRNRMDSRAAPDAREIGMALVHALITSRLSELTWTDRDLLGRALMDLHARGYSVVEAKQTLRRMRNRCVDPGDREAPALKVAVESPESELPF
ncbi:hypothetical protein [Bradyrhizobium australafricanum]|uniref:hypothetical protein n=1 Tax=Bradyrhizobium australafricanum TaxID=2821406 RepID=UPI001CE2A9B7|nr:hypothetical protein [Bradyrhizobium australafricanum]MCA6098167.1 hypothetical protein [Bradyrhizobium australafricanum]